MTKVLVLYYSSFGHIEQMAYAVAEGARQAGATADVKRVPENVPAEVANAFHFKLDQPAPVATVDELAVRSQQVVHPAWTEEAEVAEALAILEGPDEHS
jgi:NAD(P)H dehydrogenase (quinone)